MGPGFEISNSNTYKSSNNLSSLQQIPEFSVRIVVCDYYLSKPVPGVDVIYSEFRGSNIKHVPVLRIFGSTPEGQKACLHIHGVFPYFYIPCPISNPEPQYLYQVAVSLDKALNIALKQAISTTQHVYKISLVKGLPFYGFHDKEHLYLKIFLYNPGLIKQAVDLCSNGAILGQNLQPHESHLNFTLQFFIDFNLFGMSYIDLQKVKHRKSELSQQSNEPLMSPEEFCLKPESVCFYEADCLASHIINRQRVGKGDGIENPGLEEVWNQELERRKQLNLTMASKSLSQGRINSDETESHYQFENMFLMKMADFVDKPLNNVCVQTSTSISKIQYPAETNDVSQLFNATDISTHLQENISHSSNRTLCSIDNSILLDMDNTMVNEAIALNSSLSLHYSQVQLDLEDLELVDMLEDLDERPIEEDSIMGTPALAEEDNNIELDDAEYSQIFDEETICLEHTKRFDNNNDSLSWNDSFWDGVSIPQLDGTWDEEHLKKVKKRKMGSFKLGLSKFNNKKRNDAKNNEMLESMINLQETNICNNIVPEYSHKNHAPNILTGTNLTETTPVIVKEAINITCKTTSKDNITMMHSRYEKSLGELDHSNNILETSVNSKEEAKDVIIDKTVLEQETVSLCNLALEKRKIHDSVSENAATSYDFQNHYNPIPGPSSKNLPELKNNSISFHSDSFDSSPDENLGIQSFYNTTKLFDCSLEDTQKDVINSEEKYDAPDSSTSEYENEINNALKNIPKRINEGQEPHSISMTNKYQDNIITLVPKIRPPNAGHVIATLDKYLIPHNKPPEPYYSNYKDVGDKIEIGQIILKLHSRLAKDQMPFEKVLNTVSIDEWRQLLFLQINEISEGSKQLGDLIQLLANNKENILRPIRQAPTTQEVIKYIEQRHETSSIGTDKTNAYTEECSKVVEDMDSSQAIGLNEDEINASIIDKDLNNLDSTLQVTMQPDGSFLCFGNCTGSKDCSNDAPAVEMDLLTLMVVEVHTSVRGDLNPDPAFDAIQVIFITIVNNCPANHFLTRNSTEILVVDDMEKAHKILERCTFNHNITYLSSEAQVLEKLIKLVQIHDPDIMCGYEIEMNSWGYVLERAQMLGLEIVQEISRVTEKYRQKKWKTDENEFEGKIIGRIIFNVWRLFRYELALSSYSFESCMYEILKERSPKYTYRQLSDWWNSDTRMTRWITVEYYLTKMSGTIRMLEKLDIINRTSELARLFGLQWWEVLSRGSQFRVESLMLRAARPLNLVALSPTVNQRAAMRAPECLPLIFEPESRFYTDPVIVLDFQSLYPSMMIAYNYCFSTCIGRVQNITGDSHYEFGAWRLRIPKAKLAALQAKGLIHWSPVGVGFVRPSVRRGVLPALLRRILAARQAVKKGMKLQTDETVKKAMHSRQLGLKLIANVTYGYTAANFSGRMPCVEVGDSVVAKGRETLERAIALVRQNTQWNAKVVYGDTDSMFVLVPGASRAHAFNIGQEIADAVTADNPSPVALKLEKVYQPCILQTKKRYVGYMYESPAQEKPVYEAKGIETVRRDGCPAGVKLLQQSLCELFSSGDMSRVKRLVMSKLAQLAEGSLPPPELMFTREYHGPSGYRPGAAAPPQEIAKRIVSRDRRAAPRTGERVSWTVTAGAPGAALVRLARTPRELLADPALVPHIAYYASRVLLPPLHRCLSLLGVDVFKWWSEVGWYRDGAVGEGAGGGIARYMQRGRCATCGARGARSICRSCATRPVSSAAMLATRAARAATHVQHCHEICGSCCGHVHPVACENTECPLLWRRAAARHKLEQIRDVLANLPPNFNNQVFHF